MRVLLRIGLMAACAAGTLSAGAASRAAQSQPPAEAQAAGTAAAALDPLKPEPAPSEEMLGVPVFPTAQFLRSYDAGKGQRFYLFVSQASFAELVAYYRTVLKQRGYFVYEQSPTHVFEVGRFREDTMDFAPGVTIKDYTASGSRGYPNPRPGGQPSHFPTVVQIVPARER
jgi:hypothetical protein